MGDAVKNMKRDIASEIAQRLFEENEEAILAAFRKKLENGDPGVAQVLADRVLGSMDEGTAWKKLLASKNEDLVLRALMFLTEQRDGKAIAPAPPPKAAPSPWGPTFDLLCSPLPTGTQEVKRRAPATMARVRRSEGRDVPAHQRMLEQASLNVPSEETAAQDYPLSFVLDDEFAQVRAGLFGSLAYTCTLLIDDESLGDSLEDFSILMDSVEQDMRDQGIKHATIWVCVPPALRERAARLKELGFEHHGFEPQLGLDTWVSPYLAEQQHQGT